jgi:hypothetical protein
LQTAQHRLDFVNRYHSDNTGTNNGCGRARMLDATAQRDPTGLLVIYQQQCAKLFGKHDRLGLAAVERAHELFYKRRVPRLEDAQPGDARKLGRSRTAKGDFGEDGGSDQDLAVYARQDLMLADPSQRDQRPGV